MPPVITLLTDFGLEDGYVASMKGVILSICPEAILVDISHQIPPQDVRSAAFVLSTVVRDFPRGTIHLAVVDPGVGTSRLALALETGYARFVGPDNGLFSWVLQHEEGWEARSLEEASYRRLPVSKTFHGRDIFAPAAAHLARGVPLASFGPRCTPRLVPWLSPVHAPGALTGEVIHIDHFGNAITNITPKDLEIFAPSGRCTVQVGTLRLSCVSATYDTVPPSAPLALIGSSRHLEIAVNQGHAAQTLGLRTGTPVTIQRTEEV